MKESKSVSNQSGQSSAPTVPLGGRSSPRPSTPGLLSKTRKAQLATVLCLRSRRRGSSSNTRVPFSLCSEGSVLFTKVPGDKLAVQNSSILLRDKLNSQEDGILTSTSPSLLSPQQENHSGRSRFGQENCWQES